MNISSIKQRIQSKARGLFLWGKKHIWQLIIVILLLIPVFSEAWNIARAFYLINNAAIQGARYAATGQYNDIYCSADCVSDNSDIKNAAIDVARLESIYDVIQATIGNAIPIEDVKIAVCSNLPGYYYNEERNVCVPANSVGAAGGRSMVAVGYDYSLGSALGAGAAIIPIRAQRTSEVEQFRITRSISVPSPISQDISLNQQDDSEKLVVVTGNLQLVANNVDEAAKKITSIANASGGYVAQSTLQSDGSQTSANVEIRIPAGNFESALGQIKGLGSQVLSENINRKDVTKEYVDLEGRLRGLQATATQMTELLKKAQTVDEVLKVNVELGKIQEQIEQVTGEKAYLQNQSDLATLTVVVSPTRSTAGLEPLSWQPPETVQKAWHFLVAIVYFVGDVLIWVAIVGLPIGLVVWAIRKIALRLWKRKSPTPQLRPEEKP